jgi:hypothetical protein
VWTTLADSAVRDVVADVNMRDATAQLASDALPLTLASIAGRATYRAHEDGFELATEGLRFRLPNGDEAHPGRFSIVRAAPAGKASRVEVHADGIDLKIAGTLVDYFPVPRDIKGQLQRFAPRGRLSDALLTWTGGDAVHAKAYTVKGRFEDLGVNAVEPRPAARSSSTAGTRPSRSRASSARRWRSTRSRRARGGTTPTRRFGSRSRRCASPTPTSRGK